MSCRLLHYSDLENAYDDPARVGRLAGLICERRAAGDALLVGSGDDTAPGVLSLHFEGRQALDLYRAVEPDVETFGNHDFDYGLAATRDVVRESPQTWVSANVLHDGGRFGAAEGVVPWTVERCGDARVGFFGVLDDDTPSLNPAAGDLAVTDPVEAGQRAVAALRARGVDYVVALSHLGRGDDELAAKLDVDAVLGGHVPVERVERRHGTLLTRPGSGGETLLEVDLDAGTVTRHPVTDGPLDETVATALRERGAAAGLDEVVGEAAAPLERTEATLFGGESRIGNFVADAYRWATGADVALQNSGGVRDGPALAGEVTVADLVSVLPFEESVAVVELPGRALLDVFRAAAGQDLGFAEPEWWHAHVSGARLVWDDRRDELVSASVDGAAVDPDRAYTLATSEYLLYTDHEFPALDGSRRVDTAGVQHEVLADYAREVGIDPVVEGRVVRRDG